MVDVHVLAGFALASFLLVVVPGPSVLFVISRGVPLGRRAALLTVVGNAAGIYLQVVAVAAGIGSVIERSVVLYSALKLAGAAYLVYLGVQAIRHRRDLAAALDTTAAPKAPGRILREGFVVGITNPKGIVFFTAILPQFIDTGGAPVPLQMLVLGAISVSIALLSDGTWALVAGSARQLALPVAPAARGPRRLRRRGDDRPRRSAWPSPAGRTDRVADLERRGPVWVLRMDDGENRFNRTSIDSLHAALDEVDAAEGPCALVTTGDGQVLLQRPRPRLALRRRAAPTGSSTTSTGSSAGCSGSTPTRSPR